MRAWPVRRRVVLGKILAGSAGLVVAAAAAYPPSAAPSRAIAVGAPQPQLDRPAAAEAPTGVAAAQSDPAIRRFAGRVGADLSQSLAAAGVPELQGRDYVALLARAKVLGEGLSVDDRFDLVIERRDDGSLGQLLYAGMDRVARADVELMKWTDGKQVIWVNADGVGGENSAGLARPVAGRVTSSFGTRFHPILGYARMHKGVDVAAAYGSPIVAAADGRVVAAGWHGGYGNQVAIAHAGNIRTAYGHMSSIAASLGQMVRRGQVIGYVGSTGLSTGPHVHFEVTRNGRAVNPLSARLASGPATLQGKKLHQFQDQLRSLLLVQS